MVLTNDIAPKPLSTGANEDSLTALRVSAGGGSGLDVSPVSRRAETANIELEAGEAGRGKRAAKLIVSVEGYFVGAMTPVQEVSALAAVHFDVNGQDKKRSMEELHLHFESQSFRGLTGGPLRCAH